MGSGVPARRPTVRDIATHTGLSIATVSRALNDQANVAPQPRDLVQDAAQQLGTQAGRSPRGAAGAVYLRCPYVLTDYFGLIGSSIAETLELHGRTLILNAGEA